VSTQNGATNLLASSKSGPKIKTEAEHEKAELARLKRNRETRANPSYLYAYKVNLQSAKTATSVKKELESSLTDLRKHPGATTDAIIVNLILKQEAKIKDCDADIQGTPTAMPSISSDSRSGVITIDSTFVAATKNLTNQEIQFILGQYFDGRAPTESQATYQTYSLYKDDLDEIFRQWDVLSTGEIGEIFGKHKTEWNDYLRKDFKGLLYLLIFRQFPKRYTFSNAPLENPKHQPVSYEVYQEKMKHSKIKTKLETQQDQNIEQIAEEESIAEQALKAFRNMQKRNSRLIISPIPQTQNSNGATNPSITTSTHSQGSSPHESR
jgi:hypothetical protein